MIKEVYIFRPEKIGAIFTSSPYLSVLCALISHTGLTEEAHQLAVKAVELASGKTGIAYETGKFFPRDMYSAECVVYLHGGRYPCSLTRVDCSAGVWVFHFPEQCPLAELLLALNDPAAQKWVEGS